MPKDNKISSVNDYLKAIFDQASSSKKKEDSEIFWYRGESSDKWETPLVPNSYRILAETFKEINDDLFLSNHIKQLEGNINAEFYRKSMPYIISRRIINSAWNRYFLMQHYKIKTRLLDWTENATLALFFAISDPSTLEDDAIVWVLKPLELNNYTIKTILGSENNHFKVIPYGNEEDSQQELLDKDGKVRLEELTRRYLRMDFNQRKDKYQTNVYHPLAIYPTFLDERMSAQKTCFTIFGNKINGLLSIEKGEDYITSLIIDAKSKKTMLYELRTLGIDFERINPDLDGLGKSLDDKYTREFYDNRETIIHVLEAYERRNQTK